MQLDFEHLLFGGVNAFHRAVGAGDKVVAHSAEAKLPWGPDPPKMMPPAPPLRRASARTSAVKAASVMPGLAFLTAVAKRWSWMFAVLRMMLSSSSLLTAIIQSTASVSSLKAM